MDLFLILAVCVVFVMSIFTAGYNVKSNKN